MSVSLWFARDKAKRVYREFIEALSELYKEEARVGAEWRYVWLFIPNQEELDRLVEKDKERHHVFHYQVTKFPCLCHRRYSTTSMGQEVCTYEPLYEEDLFPSQE